MQAVRELLSLALDDRPYPRAALDSAAASLFDGEAPPALAGALLAALRARGESPELLAAFAGAMRARATSLAAYAGADDTRPLLDTCGTGGDHSGTFNISTAAALVAAAAGARVAKHGGRSATSKCGSADVLEALGVDIGPPPPLVPPQAAADTVAPPAAETRETLEVRAARTLRDHGLCFLFAQSFHPAMRHVAPIRRELGVRTLFNLLGPLTNPAGATHQLLGVFGKPQTRLMAETLRELGSVRALVVHGHDGLDEISTTAPTHVAELAGGTVREYVVAPEDFGIARARMEDLAGGDAAENAAIIRRLLAADPADAADPRARAAADIVALNAGAALYAAGLAGNIAEGLAAARAALAGGAAAAKLAALAGTSGGA